LGIKLHAAAVHSPKLTAQQKQSSRSLRSG
jgi:hypothetical protein